MNSHMAADMIEKCLNCGKQMYLTSETGLSDASEQKVTVTEDGGLIFSWTDKRTMTSTLYECIACDWWVQITTRGDASERLQGALPWVKPVLYLRGA